MKGICVASNAPAREIALNFVGNGFSSAIQPVDNLFLWNFFFSLSFLLGGVKWNVVEKR